MQVTVVMNWDGKNVTGIINPGPDAIPIASVYVDVTNWTVRIEADAKDASGKPVHISAEGRFEDTPSSRCVPGWMASWTPCCLLNTRSRRSAARCPTVLPDSHLDRLMNRLTKILTEARKLDPAG